MARKKCADTLDVSALESWLWEAACTIRGPLEPPKFKDCILPLVFLKRRSHVFEDAIGHLAAARCESTKYPPSPKREECRDF